MDRSCRGLIVGALLLACGGDEAGWPGDGAPGDGAPGDGSPGDGPAGDGPAGDGPAGDGPAGPDAAARGSIDRAAPWPRHEIRGGRGGADGVDLADVNHDGLLDVVSGWEQSGLVTVSFHPGLDRVTEPWPTAVIEARLPRVEDAVFADVDGDGRLDVIAAAETGQLVVLFGPAAAASTDGSAWTRVPIAAADGVQRWIKVAFADLDGDGVGDIVAGGKLGPTTAATIGWFRAPADRRRSAGWSYAPISAVGWTMSLEPRDVDRDGDIDLVVSDRRYITRPALEYGLRGSRWLENAGAAAAWTNRPIGYAPGHTGFLAVADLDGDGASDVVDGAGAAAGDTITIRRNLGSWQSWAGRVIPAPAGVGQFQAVASGDVDLDGRPDLVLSYSHAEAASGLVWLGDIRSAAARGEVSGAPGAKFDNVVLVDLDRDGDLDAVTSEQVEDLGVLWYENPLLSGPASGASARPTPLDR